MSTLIELKNVSKIYGSGNGQIKALDSINLSIEEGEFVAICGVSGSGKSTLLHLIGCLDKPTTGEITIGDNNIVNLNSSSRAELRNGKIGFVLQDFGLIPYRTSYENVMVPLYFAKSRVKDRRSKVMKALELAGVADLANRRINKLSGGQKQRVAIARALVNDAPIILADEPTGALDSVTRDEIKMLLKSVNEQGKTVIVVTHDLELADAANRVINIKDGKIV